MIVWTLAAVSTSRGQQTQVSALDLGAGIGQAAVVLLGMEDLDTGGIVQRLGNGHSHAPGELVLLHDGAFTAVSRSRPVHVGLEHVD